MSGNKHLTGHEGAVIMSTCVEMHC